MQLSSVKGYGLAPTPKVKVLPVLSSNSLLLLLTRWKILIAAPGFVPPSEALHRITAWVPDTATGFRGNGKSFTLWPHASKCFRLTRVLQKPLVSPTLTSGQHPGAQYH